MRPGEGGNIWPRRVWGLDLFAAFSLGTAVVGLRESSTIPTAAVPRNERDDRNLSVTELSLTSRGGGPREQASLLARPESALCTRTGRGKKEKLPAIFTVAGGCGPVPISNFEALCPNLVDYFCFLFEFYAWFLSKTHKSMASKQIYSPNNSIRLTKLI